MLGTTQRTRARRLPKRATHDLAAINAILDEALTCHVCFVADDHQPLVIPTLHARVGDHLYLHGSSASRTQRHLATGADVCVAITLLDGLVLARSAFHHSVNYRSVMLFGRAQPILAPADKEHALEAFIEKLVPGRWPHVRHPAPNELKATSVVRIPIAEGSAKVRTGPPIDDDDDYALPTWAGTLPAQIKYGPPHDDGRLLPGVDLPPYVAHLAQRLP
jgi:hypothetical protein